MTDASGLGRAYKKVYGALAGAHPYQHLWHFQWSGVSSLHRALKRLAPSVVGRVLDVGCGDKPYEHWFSNAAEYIGIDVTEISSADVLIEQSSPYPFPDGHFDTVIAFEVLEHVEDVEHSLSEMIRVVRPGGRLILSMPFIYNEHGAPGDFRRFSRFWGGVSQPGINESVVFRGSTTLGGIGSTLAILFLNWIEVASNTGRLTRLLKGLLLPLWLLVSLGVNTIGLILDALDRTPSFYHHVLVEFEKKALDVADGTSRKPGR